MKKPKITISVVAFSIVAAIGYNSNYVLAIPTAPSGQNGPNAAAVPAYAGATTFATDTGLTDVSYLSSISAQNALLISGGIITLDRATIDKTGNTEDENSDFYGTNAAVLIYNDATLNLKNSEITTNGSHANALFAYGTGTINASGTKITTKSNNSGGIMVAGGGTINASNLNVETSGNSSAAIRSDRGGGVINVEGGTYKTTGQGSPAVYSTADINVKEATLTSESSEGVIIEGNNSVTLENVTLTDTNNTLNGNSETYKNIFIYQSMSGDASEGTGTFVARNSDIFTNQGDTFYVTNTNAKIELYSNKFSNSDNNGAFLRAEGAKWGSSGQNGGNVQLSMEYQDVYGDIVLDEISSVELQIGKNSYYWGAINNENTGSVKLAISSGSTLVLGGDTYLEALENGDANNSNIYANGHKLYVAGEAVEVNTNTPPERADLLNEEPSPIVAPEEGINISVLLAAITAAGLTLIIIVVVAALAIRKKSQQNKPTTPPTTPIAPTTPAPTANNFPKDVDVNDISPTDKE